jgi:hypothetical protein
VRDDGGSQDSTEPSRQKLHPATSDASALLRTVTLNARDDGGRTAELGGRRRPWCVGSIPVWRFRQPFAGIQFREVGSPRWWCHVYRVGVQSGAGVVGQDPLTAAGQRDLSLLEPPDQLGERKAARLRDLCELD